MLPVPMEQAFVEKTSYVEGSRRFSDLRGVRWRIDLGILPSSPSATIDDLRRVTADSRRRYAALRRKLLVDPHVPKSGSNSPDLMDNPLSQNPDSMWGRFFRNAELERMVDQDLSRLYPEHGSYFQTPGCQSMLRRILLLWCLRHREYGYRQGMHEVLAPLLYVLHVDVNYLLEVRKLYEDYFIDKFDGFSFHENDLTYSFDFKKVSESMDDGNGSEKSSSPCDVNPKIQTVVLISDAYGAEGELGVLLSDKFMEHDAYCMFDALMNGAGGAVAMAEFFSPSPIGSSHSVLPPVIEASATLYQLLSTVDSSVHSHLVALGVEPQYFALRWLRVLFGREFALEDDLLTIWDEIFACENSKLGKSTENSCSVLDSSRGAFISAFAVSMILYLRSALLATEHATSCLQRLLNFPEDINLGNLLKKAKSLQTLAMDANNLTPLLTPAGHKLTFGRGHNSLPLDSTSTKTPLRLVSDSYWEERWRILHKEEVHKQDIVEKHVVNRKKSWSEKVRLRLSKTEYNPSSSSKVVDEGEKNLKPSVRRSLLEDLTERQGESNEDTEKIMMGGENLRQKAPVEANGPDGDDSHIPEQRCLSGNVAASEENSSIFSDLPSPINIKRADDRGTESDRSSVASNLSVQENDTDALKADLFAEGSPLPLRHDEKDDCARESVKSMNDRKLVSGKFQWLWKFGRHPGETAKACNGATGQSKVTDSSTSDGCNVSSGTSKEMIIDKNLMLTLRSLGQTMLENIQVIETVLPEDKGQAGALGNLSKNVGINSAQVTAMAALKELRKIGNFISEM